MKRIILIILLALPLRLLALDMYVATNGTGDGSSWTQATNSLMGAVEYLKSNAGGTIYITLEMKTNSISHIILAGKTDLE